MPLFDNSMGPIKDGVLRGEGNPIGAFSPPSFTVVMTKISFTFVTSLLEWPPSIKQPSSPIFSSHQKITLESFGLEI